VSQKALRMGTNLAMKTKKTMKHGQKKSLPKRTSLACHFCQKHNQNTKQKHSLLVLQTREDNHFITLNVKNQNTSESNYGEKQDLLEDHKKSRGEERGVRPPSPHATKTLSMLSLSRNYQKFLSLETRTLLSNLFINYKCFNRATQFCRWTNYNNLVGPGISTFS
jgi:hypothetical protein